jgi:hypothetical protein
MLYGEKFSGKKFLLMSRGFLFYFFVGLTNIFLTDNLIFPRLQYKKRDDKTILEDVGGRRYWGSGINRKWEQDVSTKRQERMTVGVR